jgi:glycosyltransferase involved in cell wall biosynthesis
MTASAAPGSVEAASSAKSPQSRPGRVVFVINHAGFFITHRLPLALAARTAGYDVTVVTPQSKHVQVIRDCGLQWRELRLDRSSRNPVTELRTLLALVALYRDLRPDLVHHVTAKPVLYGTVAARVAGVRAVVNAVSGLGHIFSSQGWKLEFLRRLIGLGYRAALRHRNMRVIFQNEDDRALFVSHKWLAARNTMIIRGSGVDPSVFTPAANPPAVPTVLFPARMLRTKGLIEFLDAVALLNAAGVRARYLLVGDPDPDNLASLGEEEVRSRAAAVGAEYWGRHTDMAAVLRQADIVCLPSYREGMPKSLIEAAACGLPIVTTDVPGCRDVVTHEENGLLVPIRDARAVADALQRLLADPEMRRRMGESGRRRVIASLSLQSVIDSTLSVYEELLSSVR